MEGLKLGLVEINLNFIFQIINTILLIAIIYGIFNFLFRRPKRMKERDRKIDRLEKKIDELEKKISEK